MTDDPNDEVRQVVVHPAVWPRLEEWLAQRGITLALLSPAGDDLATYVMTLTLPSEDTTR
ncbi:MAG TPA: hypothetical protein VI172_05785 [Candidatus Dormibacteraeota bacterium]|jgi:hypothetical protein